MNDTLFFLFAGLLTLFSLLAVVLPNMLHSAIALILSFFVTAALYLLMQMEFVALAQIMIYVGGIVIFMIFIILLTTSLGQKDIYKASARHRVYGAIVAGLLLGCLLFVVGSAGDLSVGRLPTSGPAASLEDVALRLLDTGAGGFVVAFEIISVLLLASLIGAVVIASREKEKRSS